jgi:RNA polymerase sigma-70 factor, ECF subfamily
VVTHLPDDQTVLLERLRLGDSEAFAQLVRQHHASMVRVAETFVPNRAIAEEVVQDTWIAVIKGLPRFEGRSLLRTWIFTILCNQARTRGQREHRSQPAADPTGEIDSDGDRSVPAARFAGPPGRGAWAQPVARWHDDPVIRHQSDETLRLVADTLRQMPEQRRRVMVLRDIEGWSSHEVREIMGISEANQRVLLHRARIQVRARLEQEGRP